MSVWPKTCKAGQWCMLRYASRRRNSHIVCHAMMQQRHEWRFCHTSAERGSLTRGCADCRSSAVMMPPLARISAARAYNNWQTLLIGKPASSLGVHSSTKLLLAAQEQAKHLHGSTHATVMSECKASKREHLPLQLPHCTQHQGLGLQSAGETLPAGDVGSNSRLWLASSKTHQDSASCRLL